MQISPFAIFQAFKHILGLRKGFRIAIGVRIGKIYLFLWPTNVFKSMRPIDKMRIVILAALV